MTDVLHVELREQTGTAATRRLRNSGRTPVVLYGHNEPNKHLSVSQREISALLRHHGKTVQLEGAVADHALVSDMQWDPLGIEVLHLDLIRVNLKESVEVTVPIRLHGEPVGVHQGGMLLENAHEVVIRCAANMIPDNIGLAIESLEMGASKHASDLEIPEGIELITPPETVLCHIEEPRGGDDEGETSGGAGEPEVVGKKDNADGAG
ncbi:50S ribosomal protein L25 [Planctomycetaceae bacterium SH139]